MAVGDVDLVQIHAIKINTHAGVEVNVTMTDEYISAALCQMNAVPATRHQHALENRLHRLDQLKAIRLRVRAFHLDIADDGQALMRGYVTLALVRIARATVSADQAKRRPLASHHNPRRAPGTVDPQRPALGQANFD